MQRNCCYSKIGVMLMVVFAAAMPLNAQTTAPANVPDQPPPQVVISEDQIKNNAELSKEQKNQVQARIEYWFSKIMTATDADQIIAASKKLLEDYDMCTTRGQEITITYPKHQAVFPMAMLGLAGKVFDQPISTTDGLLQRVREINVAMLIERCAQGVLQPVIEKMVAHRNAGVRYHGWKSYLKARPEILVQSRKLTDKPIAMLMDSVKKARDEKNGVIIGVIFEVIDFPTSGAGLGLPDSLLTEARRAAFTEVCEFWKKHYNDIMAGDSNMSQAYFKGLTTLQNIYPLVANENDDIKTIAQMLVNCMMAAAKGYQREWDQNRPQQGEALGNVVLHNNALLAQTAEQVVETITGVKKSFFVDVASKPDRSSYDRGMAMVTAAIAWVDALSKAYTIEDPKFQAPAATTKPTSAPASAPTSAPAATNTPAPIVPKAK